MSARNFSRRVCFFVAYSARAKLRWFILVVL